MAKTQNAAAAKKSASAPKGKAAKSGQQAPAKVGKLDKSAAPAPKEKPAKAPTAGQQRARSQFAGKSIKNLVPKGETKTRGDADIRFNAIVAHKKVDDAIGSTYTTGAGEERQILAVDIAYLVKRGLIEVA